MSGRAARGFTLIEVLIVVLVIGIVSGLVAFNLPPGNRGLAEREAKRLAGALEHAAALAQWKSETLGISAEGGLYRFWRRGSDDTWIALRNEEVLAPRALPADITVTPTSYAGGPVPADAVLPFRPSGRNEPYSLLVSSPEWTLVVTGDPLNRVAIAAYAASP